MVLHDEKINFLKMFILDSRLKSISIFRTSFPKFFKIIFMLFMIPL